MARRRKRDYPLLVSDLARGYLTLGLSVLPALALPFVIARLVDSVSPETVGTATAFISWALLGFATTATNLLTFSRASGRQLEEWMKRSKPGERERVLLVLNGGGATSWAVTGSAIAVVAVLALSFNPAYQAQPIVVYSGIAVVVGSLCMTISSYAVRYAREFYTVGGFEFPGTEQPRFADFVYLAVQVATSFSSADVTISSTRARRIVTANSLISFTFNTVIVALLVSVLVASSTN